MKIEIEFTSTYEATITIDGKVLKYNVLGPDAGLTGLTSDESVSTIGGIVASKLASPLYDILQGHIPDEPSPDDDSWETWEELSEHVADQVFDRIG